jgi:hypothetical protein
MQVSPLGVVTKSKTEVTSAEYLYTTAKWGCATSEIRIV